MPPPETSFRPRPWPDRPPERSPLRGARVLVVGPELGPARKLAEALSRAGCSAQAATTAAELALLERQNGWEILVTIEGVDTALLAPLLKHAGSPGWVHLATTAPACAGHEPFARLESPVREELLFVQLGRLLEQRTLERENRVLRASLAERSELESFVTRDPRMRALLATVEVIADTRANVLLTGETGTGKTLLARAIHQRSSRRDGPFVVVGCGSLPGALLESELFGHVRGAFTGAVRDKVGKFELAHQGTIFLDEINSAPLDLQVKLLRVVQERRFERVGDEKTREVDVRILAASNASLEEEIAAGRFREDLYWRLKVIALHLPPLRERPRDVVELAQHFLERFAAYYGKPVRALAPATLALLVAHAWPGNVRELENVVERAVLLAPGEALQPGRLRPGARIRAAARIAERGPRGWVERSGGASALETGPGGERTSHPGPGPRAHLRKPHAYRSDDGYQSHHPVQQDAQVRSHGGLSRLP